MARLRVLALVLACSCEGPAMQPHGRADVPGLDGPPGCSPDEPTALAACVERSRIEADVRALAAGASGRALCEERLVAYGFEVEAHGYATGTNVVGIKVGVSRPENALLVSAHHDRPPGCSGADGNASGVAVVLEVARVLARGRFDRTLVVACWDEGARDHAGSRAYAERARSRGDRSIVLVLDGVGYASSQPGTQRVPERFEEAFPEAALALVEDEHRGDFVLVVSDGATEPASRALLAHAREERLDAQQLWLTERLKQQQESVHRSDHSRFWELGLPALLVTDTGRFRNPSFHCASGDDGPDALDYDFATRVARTVARAWGELLQPRPY